jgi:hypothetical protein
MVNVFLEIFKIIRFTKEMNNNAQNICQLLVSLVLKQKIFEKE